MRIIGLDQPDEPATNPLGPPSNLRYTNAVPKSYDCLYLSLPPKNATVVFFAEALVIRWLFKMTVLNQIDRNRPRPFLALAMLLLLVAATHAQEPEVIKVETDLAAFEISVTDRSGRPVRNLTASDFRIFEDGIERSPDFFEPIRKEQSGRPMSIVFALDVSGSMTEPELQKLRSALQSFADRLADYNSYFAVTTFAMEVKTLQGFTNRREKLERSFERLKRDQDGLSTHAYDAVDDAIRMLWKKSPKFSGNRLTKRAIVVITDGFPVGDIVSPETVIERANAAETTVYAVILPSFSRLQRTKKPLLTPLEASRLIERTGGRSFYATDGSFEPLFNALAEEITASYAVAFYPNEEKRADGQFHQVRIESRKGYLIKQNRPGYKTQ
ncbi:MAG: VWA domain-containing protein [Pyrinomonadaceae bacterium]